MSEVQTKSTERMHALDGLRAVMMMLGLVIHSVISYMTVDVEVWSYLDERSTPVADHILYYIHYFRMQVFYVLAGFFSAMLVSRRGVVGMLRNRMQRIAIPFVIALLVVYPLIVSGVSFANAAQSGGISAGVAAAIDAFGTAQTYLPQSTMHLWFLYFLVYFYIATVALVWLVAFLPPELRRRGQDWFGRLLARPVLRVTVPAAICAALSYPLGGITPTDTGLFPDTVILFSYWVYFAFGWLLYAERKILSDFQRLAWTQVIAAAVLYIAVMVFIVPALGAQGAATASTLLLSVTNGLMPWLMFYGCTGLFLRYLNRPSPYVRYFVDASYWIYLIHLPFAFYLPGLIANSDLSVWLRMAIVLTGLIFIGLVTYSAFVRSTVIGQVLNGRRYSRGLPVAQMVHA